MSTLYNKFTDQILLVRVAEYAPLQDTGHYYQLGYCQLYDFDQRVVLTAQMNSSSRKFDIISTTPFSAVEADHLAAMHKKLVELGGKPKPVDGIEGAVKKVTATSLGAKKGNGPKL